MNLINDRAEILTPLPSPLKPNLTAADWYTQRRPAILQQLEQQIYGEIPPRPAQVQFKVTREKTGVFDGLGRRREVDIILKQGRKSHVIKALWYQPMQISGRIPAIVGLNFKGNAACSAETDLPLPLHDAGQPGEQQDRWQIPLILQSGMAIITASRNDIFPDEAHGRAQSIYRLFHSARELTTTHREYTAISAWARGYSLLRELAQTDPQIDPQQIWAHGHSRLGKTALWAVANDLGFAGVVSNDSGCCGASLAREKHPDSENIQRITKSFPWWFVKNLDQYRARENALPFDQNFLTALIAPRGLLIASATEDVWADPFNEYRNARAVGEVYQLFGATGLGEAAFPAPESPIFGDHVGYYLRTGIHNVTATDWKFVLEFIRRQQPQED